MFSVQKYTEMSLESVAHSNVYDMHMQCTSDDIMYVNVCLRLWWDGLLLHLYRRHSYGHALYVYDHVNSVSIYQ